MSFSCCAKYLNKSGHGNWQCQIKEAMHVHRLVLRYEGERLAVLVGTKICTFKGAAEQTYIGLFLSGGERLIRLEHTYESQKNEDLSFEYEDTKMRFETRE